MRYLLIVITMLASCNAVAQTYLHPIKSAVFQKDLFKKSTDKMISGGSPVDGQSFALISNNKTVGSFISGHGFNAQDNDVCFIGWSKKEPTISEVIPTIGFDNWEAETCAATKSVGIISKDNDASTKIAVIYEASSPNASSDEAIIFSVDNESGDISIDQGLTEKIGASGAKNIKELKALYLKLK
ncbi:hypothetical protein [Pantoea ananatis]|uniref:hypothetical protein n=2 Tax=Pantoea ananas TaxID=553 RepID=UPI000463F28C|nr:hypothetical protein [Pantoea ananatis]AMB76256.1 hypothetical protein AW734_16540 [Pantoea ananatis]MDC7867119.1 hypothetical protein [Pantoea ananatis]PKC35812.1 hypothetical protein V462_13500 [Pantoea ananatis 15320]PQK80068.1 hypothetical protein CG428_01545 [Pantoea ananatis]PQK92138.1 hypothetical protein CG432_04130 [Pantoea ananatis]